MAAKICIALLLIWSIADVNIVRGDSHGDGQPPPPGGDEGGFEWWEDDSGRLWTEQHREGGDSQSIENDNGWSKGPLFGAVIGAVIASCLALVMAVLLTFFLCRKFRQPTGSHTKQTEVASVDLKRESVIVPITAEKPPLQGVDYSLRQDDVTRPSSPPPAYRSTVSLHGLLRDPDLGLTSVGAPPESKALRY